ncbi:MAG: hypothetical protein ACR9NN_01345 [Nostochopsis sp.]
MSNVHPTMTDVKAIAPNFPTLHKYYRLCLSEAKTKKRRIQL